MKKKILSICLVVALAATAIIGASLAYFTDTDKADNTFTMNGIDIAIEEDFEQGSVVVPGLNVNKDVYVVNQEHSSDAYVRVHIAIPAVLDDGDPTFNAANNFLHFNFTNESVAAGQWSWIPTMTSGTGYLGNGAGNWNYYKTTIDEIEYAVYVVTYRTVLGAGETTATAALDKVYVDKSVTAEYDAENGAWIYKDTKGNSVSPDDFGVDGGFEIKVIAEAGQVEGFADPYAALNAQFGVPGSYNPFA